MAETLYAWTDLIRVRQWYKNALCGLPCLLVDGFTWQLGLACFLSFCWMASAVYIVNDWLDRERDAMTVDRHNRPLASKRISPHAAMACVPLLIGLSLLAHAPNISVVPLAVYAFINGAYCLWVKPVLGYGSFSAMLVLMGYLMRLLPGFYFDGDVHPQEWMLIAGFAMTLLPVVIWKQRSRWYFSSIHFSAMRWIGYCGLAIICVTLSHSLGPWVYGAWLLSIIFFSRIISDEHTREPVRAILSDRR